MKLPPVGWAFFGLAVIVLAGYILNRGIFIGSDVRHSTYLMNDGTKEDRYTKYCQYLHFTGVRQDSLWSDDELCRMFDQ